MLYKRNDAVETFTGISLIDVGSVAEHTTAILQTCVNVYVHS